MKSKVLSILHRAPPAHGASKVGDFIANNKKINEEYESYYITIKSSNTIGDIGKINFKKIYLVIELYFRVLWALLVFRPNKIYFTASVRSVAFYRDVLLSTLFKIYGFFTNVHVYYHYHTKGVNNFVSSSKKNLFLTRFFLKNVNLILLSPLLKDDFNKVKTFNKIFYLPNAVDSLIKKEDFDSYIKRKYHQVPTVNILYLSNMIKSKGYFDVLQLVKLYENKNIHFHFAGAWQKKEDEIEFFNYIREYELDDMVTFHGFINGEEKDSLLRMSHIFMFPTRYKNEAFPLAILEAMSYGLITVSTDEGSIPYIVDDNSGYLVEDIKELEKAFTKALKDVENRDKIFYIRKRYENNFNTERFETNLLGILQ